MSADPAEIDILSACLFCGAPLPAEAPVRLYCSRRCKASAWLWRRKVRRWGDTPETGTCPNCGAAFERPRADAVYCSPRCNDNHRRRLANGSTAGPRPPTRRWVEYPLRSCTVCGRLFRPEVYNARRCSLECTRAWRAARQRARRQSNR